MTRLSLLYQGLFSSITLQGPKVNDENLREICSAVVEGLLFGCISSNDIHPLSRFSGLYGGRRSNRKRLWFCLCRTTGRVYERASEETSGNWSPRYSWTSRTSRPPWSSWRGRCSRTSWTSGSQRPPRFLWNSWCTWSKRSERILNIKSFWDILFGVFQLHFVISICPTCPAGDPGVKGDKGDNGENGVGIKGSAGAPGAPGKVTFSSEAHRLFWLACLH